jgi:lysozyme
MESAVERSAVTAPLPDPSLPWPIPLAAVAIIAESEGLRLAAYRCPAGVPTIGWGETDGVRMGDTCTREQADRWLLEDVTDRTKAVRAMCTRDPSANELGALVSLAYNIGVEALRKSTALRQHNAGDHLAASRAICLWDKARVGGVLTTLPGLTARRAREQALYLTPDESVPQPVPQAVEAESPITSSPVARTGATITAGGVIAAVQEWGGQIGGLKPALDSARSLLVDTLGVPPGAVLPLVMIGAGALVIYWRRRQRAEGWA